MAEESDLTNFHGVADVLQRFALQPLVVNRGSPIVCDQNLIVLELAGQLEKAKLQLVELQLRTFEFRLNKRDFPKFFLFILLRLVFQNFPVILLYLALTHKFLSLRFLQGNQLGIVYLDARNVWMDDEAGIRNVILEPLPNEHHLPGLKYFNLRIEPFNAAVRDVGIRPIPHIITVIDNIRL